uniref:TGc domain-containing protein n=1 Tax=Echinostoma caproni TaxID=27848 RepID=A0A183B9N7_9TREM
LKHQVYDKPEVFSKVDEHAIQVMVLPVICLVWKLCTPDSYSGIHCITVSGYAKGVDYLPGDRFSGLPANHSWNVIYIRGSWQLVDAHWAARYMSSGKNVPENVVYEYDDFYFMMEPQQAVYSHFPEESRWQLLPTPLTLSQFENLPLTKSQFFKCAIDFLDQHHGVVHTRDGRLPNPADLRDRIPNIDMELKSFLLQETTKDRLNFYFRLPASGVYYLTIYAQLVENITIEFSHACIQIAHNQS